MSDSLSKRLQNLGFRERSHSGGGRKDGFEQFAKDQRVRNVLSKYQNGEIKTVNNVQSLLARDGVNVSINTLGKYIKRFKEEIWTNFVEPLEMKVYLTKFDSHKLYAIGNDKDGWRKFCLNNESKDGLYLYCYFCMQMNKKDGGIVTARAIVRNGSIKISQGHRIGCSAVAFSVLKAEKIDREKRVNVSTGLAPNPLAEWREGQKTCWSEDAKLNVSIDDTQSSTMNYPDWISARRSYNRRRNIGHPGFDNMFELPLNYKLTKIGFLRHFHGNVGHEQEDRWLRMSDGSKGIILFATKWQVEIAIRSSVLVADSTFGICPKEFNQLFTLHGLYNNERGSEWVPIAHALMTSRKEEQYIAILEELKKLWLSSGKPIFERIHCDYERAELKAFEKVFGEEVLYGCHFHFTKAALMYMRTNLPVLFKAYKNDKREKGHTWKWVRKILALPFLRENERKTYWNVLKNFDHIDAKLFTAYIEREWLKKSGNLFNFNKLIRTRGTNPAESYHSVLKRDPHALKHAALRTFLPWLQQHVQEIDSRIIKIMRNCPVKPVNKKYKKIDDDIQAAIRLYERGLEDNLTYDEFLKATDYILSFLSYRIMDVEEWQTQKDAKARIKKTQLDESESKQSDSEELDFILRVEDMPEMDSDLFVTKEKPALADKTWWSAILIDIELTTGKNVLNEIVELTGGWLDNPISLKGPYNGEVAEFRENIRAELNSCVANNANFCLVICPQKKHRTMICELMAKMEIRKDFFMQYIANDKPLQKYVEKLRISLMEPNKARLIAVINDNNIGDNEIFNDEEIVEIPNEFKAVESRKMIFNPPNEEFMSAFCYEWRYKIGKPIREFGMIKEFNNKWRPIITSYHQGDGIRGDGNCGYRSVAYCLTGNQENHIIMRKEIIAFIMTEIELFKIDPEGSHGWWQMYHDMDEIMKHVHDHKEPALSAEETKKYFENVDMLATAKLYRVNLIMCSVRTKEESERTGESLKWEIYNPGINGSLMNSKQDSNLPSIFLFYNASHFEVIMDVEKRE